MNNKDELFLRSQDAVHNLGSTVVSRVTYLDIFSSNVCIFCAILNDVTRHMRKDYHASQGFRCGLSKSEHLKTTSWFIVYFICS